MKATLIVFLLFPVLANAQYFKLALTDNSIPDEYLSKAGVSYEIGYTDRLSDFFLVDYGIRYSQGEIGEETVIQANYLSFLINPKFYIKDSKSDLKMIVGGIFRIGGSTDKAGSATYLQAWNGAEVGLSFKKFDLTTMFEASARNGVYRGKNRMKVFSLGLAYRLK